MSCVIYHVLCVMCCVSCFMCHGSCVTRCVSPVTCHLFCLLVQSSFLEISTKYCRSQTVGARELKLCENVHPSSCVTSHRSHVTCPCHVSCAIILLSLIFFRTKLLRQLMKGLLSTGLTKFSYIQGVSRKPTFNSIISGIYFFIYL